jgi:phosphoketolase
MKAQPSPLGPEFVRQTDAYWRAANYLSVGQIYLHDNPLLKKPLTRAHIKPRLLGHWGTTPGLNFVYVHLNRVIKEHDLNVISITGPGHGGPGLVANAYLEQTYSEVYPHISQDEEGMRAASWATRCHMPLARPSITPICSSPASWVMGRQKPVRSRPAGTRTSFSIRLATVPCCPSCT